MIPPQEKLKKLLELYNSKNFIEAEKMAKLITSKYPNHQFGWKVLGAVFAHFNKLEDSLNANIKALRINDRDPEAYNNLGNILLKFGNFENAELNFRKAIKLRNNYPEAYNNLGNTLRNLNRFKDSQINLRRALSLKENFPEAYNNLGSTLFQLGKLEEAEDCIKKSISLNSRIPSTYLNLCEILEKNNKLEDLLTLIKDVKNKFYEHKSDFIYYEALSCFRLEYFDRTEVSLKKINKDELTKNRILGFLKLEAEFFQYKQDYKNAFNSFKEMNNKIKNSIEYKKQKPQKYFTHQLEKISQIKELEINKVYARKIIPSWYQPTFLIGFPRSGTTLIDTILRGHSKIKVIEEKPMLQKIYKNTNYLMKISDIEDMNYFNIKNASDIYFEEAVKHCKIGNDLTLIDKFPLNIFEIPLINSVFPNAKFILAIRHPYDCVLSCWMQNFKLNNAMANMVDLDRIVELYINSMLFFNICKKRYKLDYIKIRYEDLVSNFNYEINNLISFTGLKMEEDMKDYQKSAFSRPSINTPSYSQVVRPLYQSSSYRWLNYKKHFEKYNYKIEQFICQYGYA